MCDKKTVVVTGGAKGIGAAISRLFCLRGWTVAIGYRNSEEAAFALADELNAAGGDAFAVYADLCDMTGANALRTRVLEKCGRVHALINNAGSCEYGTLADFSETEIRRSVSDNLMSAIFATKAFYDDFAFGHDGCIVNVSSVWGICGASMESVYSAAKAGVIAFTRAMAKELAPSGVRVNAVAPGAIKTDMLARFSEMELNDIISEIPLGRLGAPHDVACAVYFLADDYSSYITGQTFNVSGGYLI